jgi:hypothetical protein
MAEIDFAELCAPLVAYACVRRGVPARVAPLGIRPVTPWTGRTSCSRPRTRGRTERARADRIRAGETLRRQADFDAYLARRAQDPEHTFRAHLRGIGGAIGE